MKALVDDRECLEGLAALTMAIINGKIKGRAREALLCSVLIGLEKPGGGTRPIAMGEMFYKLAATYALRTVGETAREVLGPTQFALAPGGSEAAVLYLRTALTEHPTWTVMACDIRNAFNSRSRSDILKTLYQQKGLSAIWKLADWAYGKPSDLLLIEKGKLKGTIPSTQGVKQGDTLSSLLFALSMVKLYGNTAEAAGVKTVAVQDDVYFLGPMHSIAIAWDHFNDAVGRGTGLVLNQRKTHVLTPQGVNDDELVTRGLQSSNLMIPALGTILTRDSGVLQRWLAKEMQRAHRKLFDALRHPKLPVQVAFTLLRACALPVVQYWMRTSPPASTGVLAEQFDDLIMQAALVILDIPTSSTMARYQLRLPVKMGGFGLRSMAELADGAWVAALAQAAQYCADLFRDVRQMSEATRSPLEESLERINAKVGFDVFPRQADDFWLKYTETPARPGLQKEIMMLTLERSYQEVMSSERVTEDKSEYARLIGVRAEHAGLWLTTSPTHPLFRISDGHFRTAARIRLGMVPHDHIRRCFCKRVAFADQPLHLLSCRKLLSMNTVRHNTILNTLARVATSLFTSVKTEPRVDHKDKSRTDAIFYLRAQPAMIDVTVVSPLADAHLASALIPLGAAEKREKEKVRKYAERAREAGWLFYPFVIETTGGLGKRAEAFLKLLAEDVQSGGTQSMVQESVVGFLRKVVAFAHCTGNGLLYEEGLRMARTHFDHY